MEHITDRLEDRIIIKDGDDIFIRIHALSDWEDYDGISMDAECKAGILHFFERISYIKLQELYDANNIYLVEEKEVYDLDKLYSNRFRYIGDVLGFFTALGLFDKVTLLNNNFNRNYRNVNHKPICTFILNSFLPSSEITLEQIKTIRANATKYRFALLNRKKKRHRTELYNFLEKEDILKNSLSSIDCYYDKDSVIGDRWSFINLPHEIFTSSLVYIVTETCFYTTEYSGYSCFITEKTDKAFSHMMPFIVVGNPFSLEHIRKFGFKTFNEVWDESYDKTVDDNERMKKIQDLIIEINSWSDTELKEVMPKIMEIVEYNYHRHNELKEIKNRQKTYTFDPTGGTYYNFCFLDDLLKGK